MLSAMLYCAGQHKVCLDYRQPLATSERGLFSQRSGVFLTSLRFEHEDEVQHHMVCFDAARRLVLDNTPGNLVPWIDESDLVDSTAARRVYKDMFPLWERVYQTGVCEVYRVGPERSGPGKWIKMIGNKISEIASN